MGTYIPPHPLLAFLCFITLAAMAGVTDPRDAALLLFVCLPLAALGRELEKRLRELQGLDYHKFNNAVAEFVSVRPDFQPEAFRKDGTAWEERGKSRLVSKPDSSSLFQLLRRLIIKSLLRQVGLQICLYLFAVLVFSAFTRQLATIVTPYVPILPESWGALWVYAAVGGLLALRIRWAFACFLAFSAALFLLWVFWI